MRIRKYPAMRLVSIFFYLQALVCFIIMSALLAGVWLPPSESVGGLSESVRELGESVSAFRVALTSKVALTFGIVLTHGIAITVLMFFAEAVRILIDIQENTQRTAEKR